MLPTHLILDLPTCETFDPPKSTSHPWQIALLCLLYLIFEIQSPRNYSPHPGARFLPAELWWRGRFCCSLLQDGHQTAVPTHPEECLQTGVFLNILPLKRKFFLTILISRCRTCSAKLFRSRTAHRQLARLKKIKM